MSLFGEVVLAQLSLQYPQHNYHAECHDGLPSRKVPIVRVVVVVQFAVVVVYEIR